MRWLVTGGSGLLGINFVHHLLTRAARTSRRSIARQIEDSKGELPFAPTTRLPGVSTRPPPFRHDGV
jgi:hypothetical protein